MTLTRSWRSAFRTAILMTGLVAMLGGCVVYAGGGWGGPRHERYWR